MARLMSRKLLLGSISRELASKFLKDRGRELSEAIRAGLPEGYGYLLVLRDADGSAFFTDASKEEAIASLEEVLEHLKKGTQGQDR